MSGEVFENEPEAVVAPESGVVFDSGWLKVIRTPRGFYYAERKGVCSVAVLCYRVVDTEEGIDVLVRKQPLPIRGAQAHDDKEIELFSCPITGTMDEGKTPLEVAINEVKEEAGILVSEAEMVYVKKYSVGTQTNEEVYCFVCDVTGKSSTRVTPDGYFESKSHNEWHPISTIADAEYSGLCILYHELLNYLAKAE